MQSVVWEVHRLTPKRHTIFLEEVSRLVGVEPFRVLRPKAYERGLVGGVACERTKPVAKEGTRSTFALHLLGF